MYIIGMFIISVLIIVNNLFSAIIYDKIPLSALYKHEETLNEIYITCIIFFKKIANKNLLKKVNIDAIKILI